MELTSVARVQLPVDLSAQTIGTLTRSMSDALASASPVVLITGASADTFCLGLAIGEAANGAAPTHAFSDLLTMMHRAPKPLLAVVDGRAIGGGMGIACACDWVVASDRATFALPELLWGLVPAIIWPVLTDRMAPHVVRQWTISAHSRSAADAHGSGLVDDLVPAAGLDGAIRRGTRTLSRLDPDALTCLRGWARESRNHELPHALQRGAEITGEMVLRPSVQRRWQAFAAGEAPWSA